MPESICAIETCDHRPYGRGWCRPHYMRWYKHGDPLAGRFPVVSLGGDRFDDRYEVDDAGCWVWKLKRDRDGYGSYKHEGKTVRAHRYSWERKNGPFPDGLEPDHLCRNRACVNPDHLEAVTPRVNNLRGESPAAKNARKTHCLRGHEFTPENTRRFAAGRECKACKPVREAEARAARP